MATTEGRNFIEFSAEHDYRNEPKRPYWADYEVLRLEQKSDANGERSVRVKTQNTEESVFFTLTEAQAVQLRAWLNANIA